MENDLKNIRGDEFGLFDYHNLEKESREEKCMVIALIIVQGRIQPRDITMLFENNPFFFDWYKRTILADTPVSETYH